MNTSALTAANNLAAAQIQIREPDPTEYAWLFGKLVLNILLKKYPSRDQSPFGFAEHLRSVGVFLRNQTFEAGPVLNGDCEDTSLKVSPESPISSMNTWQSPMMLT